MPLDFPFGNADSIDRNDTKAKELQDMPINTPPFIDDSWRIFRIMAEFVEGFETMSQFGKAVTVFGSARTKPAEPYYKAAEETGRLLSKAGFGVITGGGPGIMEGRQ